MVCGGGFVEKHLCDLAYFMINVTNACQNSLYTFSLYINPMLSFYVERIITTNVKNQFYPV